MKYVYFIRNKATGLIKIGRTKRTWQRFSQLECQYGHDLELLVDVPETAEHCERVLHKRFSHLKALPGREWFLPADELLAVIKKLRER